MNFVKVWTELDDGKFKSLPAKITKTDPSSFKIQYLSPTTRKTSTGKRVYAYEDDTYEITEDSIIQRADSELSLGFEELSSANGCFVKFDTRCSSYDEDEDEDYVPSSNDESDDDDEELSSSEVSSSSSEDDDDDDDFSGDDDDDDDEFSEGCDDE